MIQPPQSFPFEALLREPKGLAIRGDHPDHLRWDTGRDLGLDLQGDPHPGPDEAEEMREDLVGHTAGVPAGPGGVESHGGMVGGSGGGRRRGKLGGDGGSITLGLGPG